jgi:ubiquinone/menaquinone biosynthesis C-methylase UbiE
LGQREHEVLASFENRVSPSYFKFAQRVYSTPAAVYERRIEAVGFMAHRRVLDAGCGFGQWALALSRRNEHVDAVDLDPVRTAVLRRMMEATGQRNVLPVTASIERLPYPDATFDAVFAYGSISLTRWRETVRELLRVLEPGGLLYVNAQGVGWYIHLWVREINRAPDYDPREWVAKAFMNTVLYRDGEPIYDFGGLIIEQEELYDELTRSGCEVLHQGAEGTILVPGAPPDPPPQPFFRGEYEGRAGLYEMVGRKR